MQTQPLVLKEPSVLEERFALHSREIHATEVATPKRKLE